ncbi:MAG TPA: ankyrin repeat domain-containing protein [Longimicrobiaceae bacterium]|nr:ankyrin repeat domain-containing protein [Longimicrobiaceae bacterium]
MESAERFFDALRAGDQPSVAALLDESPALAERRDGTGLSPVLVAAYHGHRELAAFVGTRTPELSPFERVVVGDLEGTRALLDADPEWATRITADGWTLLHGAAFFARLDILKLLLERGADPTVASTNQMRNQALHAALAGRLDRDGIALLLDRGADVNARQHGGYTALHAAAMHGDAAMVELLLARGADPAVATDDGKTAADFARENGHEDMVPILTPAG